MKILAIIESVKVVRQRQNQDGTWSPVYGVKLSAGDDEIIVESFRTKDSLEKAGIIPGAVGKAQLEFKVKEGTSEKTGKDYCFQQITLRDFNLANQNIRQESQADAAQAPESADQTEGAQEANINPETGLQF